MPQDDSAGGYVGRAWAENQVARLLSAKPNDVVVGDGPFDTIYYGPKDLAVNQQVVIPIRVQLHGSRIGRGDMSNLLGVQTSMQQQGWFAPMAVMVTLYRSSDSLQQFARDQGRVTLAAEENTPKDYPKMQIISVEEMLRQDRWPELPA